MRYLYILLINGFITVLFYFLDTYHLEEFGGLSHIGLAGLTLFFPYVLGDMPKNCLLNNITTSLIAFTPILVLKFDIITLIVVLIYSLFLNFNICNKLKKRRGFETED